MRESLPQARCVSPMSMYPPARPAQPRTVHTMVGAVSLSRPYFYCMPCQQVLSPG